MERLPETTAAAARALLAAGWRPIDPAGRVEPPLGVQANAAQWVSDECWQAMALLELLSDNSEARAVRKHCRASDQSKNGASHG